MKPMICIAAALPFMNRLEPARPMDGNGVLLIIPIAAVVLLLAAVGTFILIRRRRLSLADLMARRLQAFSPEQVVEKMRPVFMSLIPLHELGKAHGAIYPGNLFMDRDGRLCLGGGRKRSVLNTKTRPYLSMECYDADAVPGTYSDVYSLGAVMVYMLTGREPDDVMARLQQDTLIQRLGEAGIAAPLADTLWMAMVPRKEVRIHDVAALMAAPGLDLGRRLPGVTAPQSQGRKPRGPILVRKRGRNILIGAGVLLAALAAIWIIQEHKYQTAVNCLSRWEFQQADEALAGTLLIYRDMADLGPYVHAGRLLEWEQYDEARAAFEDMGRYRDSRDLALECDYRKAEAMLKEGRYEQAKELFAALEDYEDAEDMVLECDYRKAMEMLDEGNYDSARELFEILGDYSDSGDWAMECDYRHGMDLLEQDQYKMARSFFKELAQAEYKDAAIMVQESDYLLANSLYENFINADLTDRAFADIQNALSLYKQLQDYSNSAEKLEKAEAAVFDTAEALFELAFQWYNFNEHEMKGDWDVVSEYYGQQTKAEGFFKLISDYGQSELYLKTLDALDKSTDSLQFDALYILWNFEPAQRLILSDYYINDFLAGTWLGDGKTFEVTFESDGSSYWYSDIPAYDGDYLMNANLYGYVGSDRDGWQKTYHFIIINKNCMTIYSYKSGASYTLYRQ